MVVCSKIFHGYNMTLPPYYQTKKRVQTGVGDPSLIRQKAFGWGIFLLVYSKKQDQ